MINGAVLALTKAFNTSSWLTGLAVSLALLGSAVGAFCAGQIANRYGRVKAMVVASVLFTISALGSGFAFSIWDFILWRLLGGVAVGVASVIVPAYIAECSPAAMRGRLGSLQQLAIVLGIFIALLRDRSASLICPIWLGQMAGCYQLFGWESVCLSCSNLWGLT